MTRHVVAIEGKPSILPDTWLAKGSLRLDQDRKIPVIWSFSSEDIIGRAEHIQRDDETGEVSVEVTFREGFEIPDRAFDYTFAANRLVEEKVAATDEIPEHRLILEAHLIQVALVPSSAAFPKPSVSQKTQGS